MVYLGLAAFIKLGPDMYILKLILISSILSSSSYGAELSTISPRPGVSLHTYHQEAIPGNRSEALVLYIQGQSDYLEMFAHIGDRVTKKLDTDFFTYDVQGQGKSSGDRCHMENFQDYIDDLDYVIRDLKESYSQIHIIAHSTGGLVASAYLINNPKALPKGSTVSLVAPFFDVVGSKAWKLTARTLARTLGTLRISKKRRTPGSQHCGAFADNDLTHNREYFDRYLCSQKCGTPTWGWLNSAFRLQKELKKRTFNLSYPTLMIAAGEDKVVDNDEASRYCSEASQCRWLAIENGYHGLIYEDLEKQEKVFTAIEGLIKAQDAKLPPKAGQ